MSKVALSAGIPLNKFVEDNNGIVKDLDAPLDGKRLVVCNPKPGKSLAAGWPYAEQWPWCSLVLRIDSSPDKQCALLPSACISQKLQFT